MLGKMHNNKCTIFHPFIFPKGKVVHQSLNIMNSFSQKVKIQHIRSLSEDVRFYYKRLRSNKEELESGKKSKVCFCLLLQVVIFFPFCVLHIWVWSSEIFLLSSVIEFTVQFLIWSALTVLQIANIYFDPGLQCGDHCYVGLPFLSKCK